MRKRKRPEFTQRVLKYRAYPDHIPQALWDTAHAQRRLWNNLTALWKTTADLATEFPKRKKPLWQEFEAWAKAAVAQSGLDWVNGPEVLDHLRAGVRARKFPTFHGGLKRVMVAHRFTNGGLPLADAVNGRGKRLRLLSGPRNPRAGRFGLGDAGIDFTLAPDRPLPTDAILKRAAWLGEHQGGRWYWYLALTIEEPPPAPTISQSKLTAGLDLGWRLFADGSKRDYLRVGMLMDSEGRAIELRLPLYARPNRPQENNGLPTLAEYQQRASQCIDAAKAQVGRSGQKIGRRGLLRMLANPEVKLAPETIDLGRGLIRWSDWIYAEISYRRFRLIQRRRWYYQNLAHWLGQRYARICLEGQMPLPPLHVKTDDPALRAAAVYRNHAAVGELRGYLRRIAPRHGCEVVEGDAVDSTVICHVCAEKAEAGASLLRTCPNGHQWDQDINAARNLLSQLDGSFGQPHGLRKSRGARAWQRLAIPERLATVAVEVPAV